MSFRWHWLWEDADERVEEAVEEMLDNLWRRIDGSEEWMDMTDRRAVGEHVDSKNIKT